MFSTDFCTLHVILERSMVDVASHHGLQTGLQCKSVWKVRGTPCSLLENRMCESNFELRVTKRSFNNYVDRILQFFAPPPLRGQFLHPVRGQNQTFFDLIPPHLVHVVIEWPLKKCQRQNCLLTFYTIGSIFKMRHILGIEYLGSQNFNLGVVPIFHCIYCSANHFGKCEALLLAVYWKTECAKASNFEFRVTK